jgi:hypothetical protein
MVQPFGTDFTEPPSDEDHPSDLVRLFLHQLAVMVRRVCRAMFEEAVNELNLLDSTIDAERVASERIVLYERVGRPLLGTGLQSRLFYVEGYNDATRNIERAVYEWVAADPSDLFYRRTEKGSLELDPFSEQFLPILHYWRTRGDRRRLPSTAEQLAVAVNDVNASPDYGIRFSKSHWIPYEVAHASR